MKLAAISSKLWQISDIDPLELLILHNLPIYSKNFTPKYKNKIFPSPIESIEPIEPIEIEQNKQEKEIKKDWQDFVISEISEKAAIEEKIVENNIKIIKDRKSVV